MKKVITTSLVFILILMASANVFAVSATASVVSDTTSITPGSTFTVYLHVSDLSSSTDVAIARMSYDSSMVELVSYTNATGWSEMVEGDSINMSYTPSESDLAGWNNPEENDTFISFVVTRSSGSSDDQDIVGFTFKLSENATVGSTTVISFPYINLAVGGEDFEGEASLTFSVIEATTEDPNDDNTGDTGDDNTDDNNNTGNTGDSSNTNGTTNTDNTDEGKDDDTTGSGNTTGNDNTTVDSSLPQTGDNIAMMCITLGIVLIIGGAVVIKYIKMKDIR